MRIFARFPSGREIDIADGGFVAELRDRRGDAPRLQLRVLPAAPSHTAMDYVLEMTADEFREVGTIAAQLEGAPDD